MIELSLRQDQARWKTLLLLFDKEECAKKWAYLILQSHHVAGWVNSSYVASCYGHTEYYAQQLLDYDSNIEITTSRIEHEKEQGLRRGDYGYRIISSPV